MIAKLNFLFILLAVSSFAFSQTTPKQKDSDAKASAMVDGKATIYIIRPTAYGAIVQMKLQCDSTYIGATKAKQYVYTVVSPGTHRLFSKAENKAFLDVDVEAGKTYYVKQEVKMGFAFAETGLKLMDEEDGKKALEKCKLSKDNVYTGQ